jgi:hypothetical protein
VQFPGEEEKTSNNKDQKREVGRRWRSRGDGGRLVVVAAVLLGSALVFLLVSGRHPGSLLVAHAADNPLPGGTSGFSLTKNPVVRVFCCLGIIKGIHKQRQWIKVRAALATRKAVRKLKAKKVEAICIPLVAAFVGWLTNWLAVQMLFYPVDFLGVSLKRYVVDSVYSCDVLQPLGILGWQGVVPAKAAKMGFAMVNMVTTKLIDVQEVFAKLDPSKAATLLSIEVPDLARNVAKSLFPQWTVSMAEHQMLPKLTMDVKSALLGFQHEYLAGFVRCMQGNLSKVINVDEFVTKYYVSNTTVLNRLFQICGEKELEFLVNSGVWFGFLLGLPQIVVWAFVDNIWSLVIGGMIVGTATNWLALKLIFEPVLPVPFPFKNSPFTIQGIFLKRQQEVSTAFADYYSTFILKSKLFWNYIFTGGQKEQFKELMVDYNTEVIHDVAGALSVRSDLVDPEVVRELSTMGAEKVLEELPKHVYVLHDYIDKTLNLRPLLEDGLRNLSPKEFEQVLHPVFQEEEFILIVAGAFLGALAGAVQYLASDYFRGLKPKNTKAATEEEENKGKGTDTAAATTA